jgi:hypothetical protein
MWRLDLLPKSFILTVGAFFIAFLAPCSRLAFGFQAPRLALPSISTRQKLI